jgi:hypothetical protein
MLFSEASEKSLDIEKNSKYTGKTTRANKDDYFTIEQMKKMLDFVKFNNQQTVDSKKLLQFANKIKRKSLRTKDLLDLSKKSPFSRLQKRLLQLLRR